MPIMSRPMLSRLRSPPLNVFFTALPTTASRRSPSPSSTSLPSRRRIRSRRDRCGARIAAAKLKILPDGQVLVEGVFLRDVTDVALELVEILIKRLAIEQDLSAASAEAARPSTFRSVLLPEPLAPITQTSSPRLTAEGNAVQRHLAVAETMSHIAHLERANDVALFLDDSFGKIAAQELADVDPDGVAILQSGAVVRTGVSPTMIGRSASITSSCADPLVVIAENLQQHVAARPGRKQNVVGLEQARIVRDQIFGLGGLELEPATHRAGAPPQIESSPVSLSL